MAGPHRRSVEPEFSRLNAPWTLNRTGVPNTPGLVSIAPSVSMPSRRVISVRPPIGVLLYLVSVGFVGAVIVGLFFGSAFLLLGQPIGQIQTGPTTATRWSTPRAPPNHLRALKTVHGRMEGRRRSV